MTTQFIQIEKNQFQTSMNITKRQVHGKYTGDNDPNNTKQMETRHSTEVTKDRTESENKLRTNRNKNDKNEQVRPPPLTEKSL